MKLQNTDNKAQACMHPRCADCRFYDDQYDNPDYDHMEVGYCRKYAPRPFTVQSGLSETEDLNWAFFPLMQEHDFCGEFESKTEAAEGMLPWQKVRLRAEAPQTRNVAVSARTDD